MTIVLAMSIAVAAPIATFQNASPRFPSRLDTYFKKTVGLTAEEQQQLASGQPVTKLLAADESKEVAVFGAIWINVPIRRYAEAVRTSRISSGAAGSRSPSESALPRSSRISRSCSSGRTTWTTCAGAASTTAR